MRVRHCLVFAILTGLALAPCASAQNIDYGALEQMFGEPVTTSATGSPQLAGQAPADMQIITADDIRRSGATDIPDILRFVAGIDVRSYGAMDNDVSVGGFSQVMNPRLLVLINGRQVFIDDEGYTPWQTLPVQLNDIRQIEIVQGPASALFGFFGAASGVVNIITYDPLTDRTDNVEFGMGTDGTLTGSLVSTLQEQGKGGVTVSLGGLRTNEYSTASLPASPAPYYSKPIAGNFDVDARAKPTANTEITLDITHSQATSLYQTTLYIPAKIAYRINSVKLGFAADTPWGLVTLLAYQNQMIGSLTQAALGLNDDSNLNQITVVQLGDLLKFANVHTLRVGLEYRSNREWGQPFNGALGYQDYAGSLMWNWQITPKLALTNAARVDRLVVGRTDPLSSEDPFTLADYGHSGFTGVSFNSGLVYQPTANDTLRLLIGRSVQPPSMYDYGFDLQIQAGPVTVVQAGNPFLKPSTTTNYEIDYDRVLPGLQSTLQTAVYYNVIRGFLAAGGNTPSTFSDGEALSVAENIGNGEALGGRIGLTGSNAAGWRWRLFYTLVGVRDKLNAEPPSIPFNFNNAVPNSTIDFGLGYSWGKFEADVEGKWQSRYTDYILTPSETGDLYEPVPISNFVALSARLGYRLTPRLTLAVAGQQLQAAQTFETAGTKPERRLLFSATYGF